MRFWFWVGEPSWLSGSWAHALDYWSCWIDWDCPRPETSLLHSTGFTFRLFSHHQEPGGVGEECRGFTAGSKLPQAEPVPSPCWPQISATVLIVTLLPLTLFTLSRMWLPALNICVCWLLFLCLQSCWFPVHEHGKKFWFVYQQSMH